MNSQRENCDFGVVQQRTTVSNARPNNFPKYITLDVGGHKFKTELATLLQDPESMLAAMFSGRGFRLEQDDSGAYFIDRDGMHFRHILNYLRGSFDVRGLTEQERFQLLAEANYFAIRGLEDMLTPPCVIASLPPTGPGLMHWLGTQQGKQEFVSPYQLGLVDVRARQANEAQLAALTAFTQKHESDHDSACGGTDIITDIMEGCMSSPLSTWWFVLDLKYMVHVTHYSLLSMHTTHHAARTSNDSKWLVEGSADGEHFVTLDAHQDNLVGTPKIYGTATAGRYRYLRFTSTIYARESNSIFRPVRCVEVYGDVIGKTSDCVC